jgi:hypothetical protein
MVCVRKKALVKDSGTFCAGKGSSFDRQWRFYRARLRGNSRQATTPKIVTQQLHHS